ncbi:lysozyme family protein [Longicatena caecimuris]|uniref:lysozyme family protein n=1 Tax=Longicatena caecimuris TaxID=1796635 RepID=UPI0039954DBC
MSKSIKTRDIIKDVKSIDKALIAGEHIRNISSKTKDKIEENTQPQHTSPNDYAVSKVNENAKHLANKTAIETKIQVQKGYRYIKSKQKSKKDTVLDDIDSSSDTPSKIKAKEHAQKNIRTTNRKTKKEIKNTKSNIKDSISSGKTIKNTSKTTIKTSQEIAKQSAIKSAQVSKESYHTIKAIGRKSWSVSKKGVSAVKRIIDTTRTSLTFLCSIGWIAILIILLIALIGGIFMTGSSSSGSGNQLSKEVIEYTPIIQKYADEYEIPHFINALQAIMMQESGGKGTDPMQSSECSFNTKFPNTPNAITDPEYSIQVGVQNFADCLKRANCTDPLDIPLLSLAMQGYNFGNGYIEWALTNFGAYSQGNAKVFSDVQARKHGWNSYGDPEYVPHVMRYYQFASLGTSNSNLVNIAISQLGNQGGTPYWSWYGYKERVEWCACFVSWVAYQSGDLDITIPKFSAVRDGIKYYQDKDQWKDKSYTPKTGDLIFFDWQRDGISDHVGIVEKVENNIIYTVEGNSNDQCKQNTYTINSYVIYGYGTY